MTSNVMRALLSIAVLSAVVFAWPSPQTFNTSISGGGFSRSVSWEDEIVTTWQQLRDREPLETEHASFMMISIRDPDGLRPQSLESVITTVVVRNDISNTIHLAADFNTRGFVFKSTEATQSDLDNDLFDWPSASTNITIAESIELAGRTAQEVGHHGLPMECFIQRLPTISDLIFRCVYVRLSETSDFSRDLNFFLNIRTRGWASFQGPPTDIGNLTAETSVQLLSNDTLAHKTVPSLLNYGSPVS